MYIILKYIFLFFVILILLVGAIKTILKKLVYKKSSNTTNKKNKVVGRIIDFEVITNGWYSYLSPVISYEVDGKEYRCIMYTLVCDDTKENRTLYMNKEYTLYYNEKYPNRVRINSINNQNMIVVLLIFFIIFMSIIAGGLI